LPLLVLGILRQSDEESRLELIRQLFTLIKKPDAKQRQLILEGCTSIVGDEAAKEKPDLQFLMDAMLTQCLELVSKQTRKFGISRGCVDGEQVF
jgi:hypothetical protein